MNLHEARVEVERMVSSDYRQREIRRLNHGQVEACARTEEQRQMVAFRSTAVSRDLRVLDQATS